MRGEYRTVQHWRDRAEELIALVNEMNDDYCKRALLRCAAGYELIAQRLEEEERRRRNG